MRANATQTTDAPIPARRRFLAALWLGLGGVALLELIWVAASFVRPRRRRAAPDALRALVVAGPVARFAPGSVTAFREGRFYLVRLDDGGFLALHRQCTHLGCTVPWIAEEQRFACPCHGSAFDVRGDVLNPPAPRALDLFPVRIENGVVKVDTSAPVRRASFDPAQVART
ncbi:MAG TPA: Rieske (2Fe-2S) protein [Myxococcota bacterium]